MKDEDKTKAELIKELKTIRKEREKSAVYNITEHKQAEEELKDSEERLKILFDYAPEAYYINDSKGNFIDGNKAAERLIGYKREELIGKSFLKLKLLSLADIPKVAKVLTKNIMGQPTGPDELVLNRKDNSKVVVEVSAYPVKIKGKTLILGIARDITERKQAEKALLKALAQANEGKYTLDALMEQVPEGITIADAPDVRIRMVSRYGRELTGKSKEILEGITVDKHADQWDIYCADGVTPAKNEDLPLTRATQKGEVVKDEEWVLGNQFNRRVPILCNAGPIKDGKGNITGGVIAWRDITQRKQAEEKIKHLNLVLYAIRNVNQLIVKEKDPNRLIKGACENLTEKRGYHNAWIALLDGEGKFRTYAEAGLGKTFLPMIELLKRGKLPTCSKRALKQQEVVLTRDPASTCTECPLSQKYSDRAGFTIRLEHSGKVYGLMSVSIPAHLADDQEEQDLFEEVAEDIAFGIHNIELDEERKLAEENVKNTKDELQMIMDSVPALIFYKNTKGRLVRTNKANADAIGIPMKDIIGMTTEELFPKEQAKKMRKDDKEVIISGKAKKNIIEPFSTPDGIRWQSIDKIPYKDNKGKVIGIIGLSKDITFQKEAEQKLQQSYQKLKKTMDAAIDTMSNIIEAKDPYTSGHQHRVCQLAIRIAQEMKLSPDKIEGVRIASLIHDIGKIGLPTEILSKPGKLTDIEFSLIKGHSQVGYDILKPVDFSYPIAQIVLQHHERLDGSGYPNKLNGDKIILEAKIIGIADVVEAMSSFRPYRPALGIDAALEEISQNKGILYDPEVVDTCIKLFKEKEFKL